jgi:chromosomal replication initiator protein
LTDQDKLWSEVLSFLEKKTSVTAVKTWFDDSRALELTQDAAVIYTPSEFKRDVILNRYLPQLKEAFRSILGSTGIRIEILTGPMTYESKSSPVSSNTASQSYNEFTFDRFVVGNSNKFAHAAALAVAREPAKAYNPLFIYGGSGLGKTHLLYAIANEIRRSYPSFRIVYIKGDDFTNELVSSIQVNKSMEFREKYRLADILLVDDIQFIAGKDRTQEEFFHTFNTLYESNRQIILTSDRPPREMARLEDRLRTRFEWGLLADIQPPEYETRLAIIKNKAESLGLEMPENVAEYIAQNITANIRQLEGTMKKILALRDLMKSNVDMDTVTRAISDILRSNPGMRPTPQIIIDEVCSFYSISDKNLRGQRRDADIVLARQVAMYLIRRLTDLSFPEIGREFDGRHHATVLHSVEKIEEDMEKNIDFAATIKNLIDNISNK